jgi:hypothetical protein
MPGSSGRSDDANFVNNEIPAVHFFTGMHGEYHAPSDRAHTVNPAGARDVLRLIHHLTLELASRPEMLTFTEPRRVRTEDRGYAPVRLGIQPGMAAEGQTNRDIAQTLFVTPKTVEVHLSNAYRKLGIRSRRELGEALTPGQGSRKD